MPLVSRTRATLRSAEFGFRGVVVYTRTQTPRRCGLPLRAGRLALVTLSWRPLRTSWAMVGMGGLSSPGSVLRSGSCIRPPRSGVSPSRGPPVNESKGTVGVRALALLSRALPGTRDGPGHPGHEGEGYPSNSGRSKPTLAAGPAASGEGRQIRILHRSATPYRRVYSGSRRLPMPYYQTEDGQ